MPSGVEFVYRSRKVKEALKRRLASPQWIDHVSWNEQKVYVNISCETIIQSPEYLDNVLLSWDYQTKLYSYYNFTGYWIEEPAEKDHSF